MAALTTIEQEKNPIILAAAIRALGAYSKPETRELLLKYLDSNSFRNELASAAVSAMRSQDDPSYIAPLLASLPQTRDQLHQPQLRQALGALAYLSRNEENKDAVRRVSHRLCELALQTQLAKSPASMPSARWATRRPSACSRPSPLRRRTVRKTLPPRAPSPTSARAANRRMNSKACARKFWPCKRPTRDLRNTTRRVANRIQKRRPHQRPPAPRIPSPRKRNPRKAAARR